MATREPSKLEAMLTHLLNDKPGGRPWAAITVPGFPRFTVVDVHRELERAKADAK